LHYVANFACTENPLLGPGPIFFIFVILYKAGQDSLCVRLLGHCEGRIHSSRTSIGWSHEQLSRSAGLVSQATSAVTDTAGKEEIRIRCSARISSVPPPRPTPYPHPDPLPSPYISPLHKFGQLFSYLMRITPKSILVKKVIRLTRGWTLTALGAVASQLLLLSLAETRRQVLLYAVTAQSQHVSLWLSLTADTPTYVKVRCSNMTASVVWWAHFPAADPQVPGSILGTTGFSE
jgi:hypothetical protein